MVPVGRLLVLRYTPKERRMEAMSNLVWPALVAPVIAPPLGGFIASHASWHWIFFLNVPLGIVACALALWLIPTLEPAPYQRFDWMGFVFCGLGIFALLSALERLAAAVDTPGLAVLATGGCICSDNRAASTPSASGGPSTSTQSGCNPAKARTRLRAQPGPWWRMPK